MKNNDMKQTIAKKLTTKLAVLTVVVLAILIVCSYITVSRIVLNETKHYTNSIVSIYADAVAYDAEGMHFPIDIDHTYSIETFGKYVCQWYRIDYSYAYSIYPDENKICVLGFYKKDGLDFDIPSLSEFTGKELDYTPSAEEKKLWDKEEMLTVVKNNRFERAMDSIFYIEDNYGNKVIFGVGISLNGITKTTLTEFAKILIIILIVFAIMTSAMYFVIRKSVFNPAKRISESMIAFIKDGKRSGIKLDETGEDEFAMIAKAFNSMTVDIDEYLSDINSLTSIQERQSAELNIASEIQQSFLSDSEFCTENYFIQAMMKPAKEVGGDLYDYLPLDDEKILITVADVSGKGISASMYMAVSLVLMRQFARMGYSPAQILQSTNSVISERNSSMLFITSFVAIYDPKTKKLTYSNAGHNPPYIIGCKPYFLNENTNPLLGIFGSEEYSQAEIQLENGDIVFLYTDGVNEARNASNTFFGESRLEASLAEFRKTRSGNVVSHVFDSVSAFASNAEQYDDITMLALTVRDYTEMELDVDCAEFEKISEMILASGIERNDQLNLCVIAEEIFVNICSYAFPEGVPDGEKIRFCFEHSDRIELKFEDGGIRFDPTENVIDAEDYDPDEQIGGLGRFIAVNMADEVKYEYLNGRNTIKIIKYLKEA